MSKTCNWCGWVRSILKKNNFETATYQDVGLVVIRPVCNDCCDHLKIVKVYHIFPPVFSRQLWDEKGIQIKYKMTDKCSSQK